MAEAKKEYLVLARKYRPTNFSELIGQDAMVRTISNAIKMNRVAHAFILTGIRGIGKTTSARIIAKALNCVGTDGNGGPTADPCGVCEQCRSIAEDRNVDVIETDAASRTGIDDVREIIDNVQYLPVAGRYKIYIIDEVHMLSTKAFNALLKTLEEPPPHVKFIFATTEIRKIPLTIISRCQRFDLSRVDHELLSRRFAEIAGLEGYKIEPGAAEIIAKAAQGSVRDGLSILDRALSSSEGSVTEDQVRDLLGISEGDKIFDLFEKSAGGNIKEALIELRKMYNSGSDVVTIFEDLLELTHFFTQIKINPEAAGLAYIADNEINRAKQIAEKLSVPFLVRCWQILLKGVGEIKLAPNPITAAEMVLIKLTHTSDLPTPNDLIRKARRDNMADQAPERKEAQKELVEAPVMRQERVAVNNFREMVELFAERDETLHYWLVNEVHLVSFEKGRIEFRPGPTAPKDLANRISEQLKSLTGERWVAVIASQGGARTIKDEMNEAEAKARQEALSNKAVKALLEAFPEAKVRAVRRSERKIEQPAITETEELKSGEAQ